MKPRIVLLALALSLALPVFGGCSRRAGRSAVVAVDLYHAQAWDGIAETLGREGFTVKPLDGPIDAAVLTGVDALILIRPTQPYARDEQAAISSFVMRGGGLLCAGQAWSWTAEAYDNRPLEDFPLNRLGAEYGFWITDKNVGEPAQPEGGILTGIREVHRTDWWPSEIELSGPDVRVILRDREMRAIAGTLESGQARVAVVGHDLLLRDNPAILTRLLEYLARLR